MRSWQQHAVDDSGARRNNCVVTDDAVEDHRRCIDGGGSRHRLTVIVDTSTVQEVEIRCPIQVWATGIDPIILRRVAVQTTCLDEQRKRRPLDGHTLVVRNPIEDRGLEDVGPGVDEVAGLGA